MRPIYPMPGFTEAEALAVLQSRQFAFADCYTISTKDGSILRYSTVQKDMEVIPLSDPATTVTVLFTSKSVKVSGLKLKISVGVEVDEQTLQFDWDPDFNYLGQPLAAAIIRGRFDGAILRRDRYWRKSWNTPWVGGSPLFIGRLSTADSVGRSSAQLKVKSELVLLDMDMPRKIFGGSCQWTLFDPDCGLNRDDFITAATVGAGATSSSIPWAGVNDGFKYGVIHIVDQEAVTQVRTIKDVAGGVVYLVSPLDFVPETGSNFNIYPGCIRTFARCTELNNTEHFQAFEFVPKPETAY